MPIVFQQNGQDGDKSTFPPPSSEKRQEFQKTVLDFYSTSGRTFAWRETTDPYAIAVSEFMLQQTQTTRVVPYYQNFLSHLPTWEALAGASLHTVLSLWSGLGYNRRAKALKHCAEQVVAIHNGLLPLDTFSLLSLPGIGNYTAGALQAFIGNLPVIMIETNIRSAVISYFFSTYTAIGDKEISLILEASLERENPRIWYYALMDYGNYVKSLDPLLTQKSSHYKKQSRFKGSLREVRGAIIRLLSKGEVATANLFKSLPFKRELVCKALNNLESEKLIERTSHGFTLPN